MSIRGLYVCLHEKTAPTATIMSEFPLASVVVVLLVGRGSNVYLQTPAVSPVTACNCTCIAFAHTHTQPFSRIYNYTQTVFIANRQCHICSLALPARSLSVSPKLERLYFVAETSVEFFAFIHIFSLYSMCVCASL